MFLDKRDNEIAYSYDKYIEPVLEEEEQDYYDEYVFMKGENMKREVINLKDISYVEAEKLIDYVWKGEYLIPAEMFEGE